MAATVPMILTTDFTILMAHTSTAIRLHDDPMIGNKI
jgi:hypothetical protein